MAIQQRNEYEQVVNERDILGTQLIRRNGKLAQRREKIQIQQNTLRKGEPSTRNASTTSACLSSRPRT